MEELYDMYSEEEEAPRIVEVAEDGLDFDSDLEGRLADPVIIWPRWPSNIDRW